jgi:hypothetical protein
MLLMAPLLVCLPTLQAQSTSVATVIAQVGSVSVLKDASRYETALMMGGRVSAGQIVKTGSDGYAKFIVEDKSTFEVFPNSEVSFRQTMSIGDLLNVWIGRVKVYIQHLPGVPNPNNVTTPTALISVRGTVFTVEQAADGTTTVSVDEGRVEVAHRVLGGRTIFVNTGEAKVIDPRVPLAMVVDKGGILYKGLRMAEQALRQVLIERPGGAPGSGGSTPVGTAGGAQGDKGKPTGTGTGTGAPTGGAPTGTGAPSGTPPPPPPGGGGGA